MAQDPKPLSLFANRSFGLVLGAAVQPDPPLPPHLPAVQAAARSEVRVGLSRSALVMQLPPVTCDVSFYSASRALQITRHTSHVTRYPGLCGCRKRLTCGSAITGPAMPVLLRLNDADSGSKPRWAQHFWRIAAVVAIRNSKMVLVLLKSYTGIGSVRVSESHTDAIILNRIQMP